jgi:hypothetical protein
MDFDVIFDREHVLSLISTAFLTERLDIYCIEFTALFMYSRTVSNPSLA